jgi:hypothetical protein
MYLGCVLALFNEFQLLITISQVGLYLLRGKSRPTCERGWGVKNILIK